MNKYQIDYWLRWFDEEGIFDVDFNGADYDELVEDLAGLGIANPFHLLITIGRCIDE